MRERSEGFSIFIYFSRMHFNLRFNELGKKLKLKQISRDNTERNINFYSFSTLSF